MLFSYEPIAGFLLQLTVLGPQPYSSHFLLSHAHSFLFTIICL
nr:MAG TPA: hypothetical protein [Caudoviricetes sp.]